MRSSRQLGKLIFLAGIFLSYSQIKEILQYADASQQAVLVGLLAELGRDYFDLRDYQQQIEITLKNLEIQKKTLSLIKAQQKGAMASDFDVRACSRPRYQRRNQNCPS